MSTLTITEFLEARIAEDEAGVLRAAESEAESNRSDGMPDTTAADVLAYWTEVQERGDHLRWTRLLAECAAKRAIIAEAFDYGPNANWAADDRVLRHLAAVYKDHPDYQQDWAL